VVLLSSKWCSGVVHYKLSSTAVLSRFCHLRQPISVSTGVIYNVLFQSKCRAAAFLAPNLLTVACLPCLSSFELNGLYLLAIFKLLQAKRSLLAPPHGNISFGLVAASPHGNALSILVAAPPQGDILSSLSAAPHGGNFIFSLPHGDN
jgi:hypothetical protein